MKRNLAVALAFLAAASSLAAADTASLGVRIVSPPDRFFVSSPLLDLAVVTAPRSEDRLLLLRVDGNVQEEFRLPAHVGSLTHTFEIPVSALDPPAFIEVCLAKGGGRTDPASCAAVRAAGPVDWQKLRETMEETEEIGRAIDRYSRHLAGFLVPQRLAQLVPVYLARLPSESPLGGRYEYSGAGVHFFLETSLPGSGRIRYEDGAFTELPRGAITDKHASRVVRQQLWEMAVGLESYRIDGQFPDRLEDLMPFYARWVYAVDPYGNPYSVRLLPQEYELKSFGRDGRPGGDGLDADTIMTTNLQLQSSTTYRGEQEYIRSTLLQLISAGFSVRNCVQSMGFLPHSQDEFVACGAWEPRDSCGNVLQYVFRDQGDFQWYQVKAPGCDGMFDTDSTEMFIYGTGSGFTTYGFEWPVAYFNPGWLD